MELSRRLFTANVLSTVSHTGVQTVHWITKALSGAVLLGLLAFASTAHSQDTYTPCSSSGYAPASGSSIVETTPLDYAGESIGVAYFCTYPQTDPTTGLEEDFNWVEAENFTATGIYCAAALYITDANGEASLGGSGYNNIVYVNQVLVVANTGFQDNTGIDIANSTITCSPLSSGSGGTGNGSGGGGSSGGGGAGGSSGGSSGGTSSGEPLSLLGSINVDAINYTNDTTVISIGGVQNTSGATSGTVQFQLWFLPAPYTGGGISMGNLVASFQLSGDCTTGQGQLAAGAMCDSITSGTITVTLPPAGTYYAVVTVDEYDPANCGTTGGGYCVVQGVQLPTQVTVPTASASGSGASSTSSSSGGGGGFDETVIALLSALVALRFRRLVVPKVYLVRVLGPP